MSLINDALKKAQRERENQNTGGAFTPPPPSANFPSPASPPPPRGRPWLLIAALVVFVSGLTAWLTSRISTKPAEAPVVTAAPKPTAAPQATATPSAPLVVAAAEPTRAPAPTSRPAPTMAPRRQATPVPTQAPMVAPAKSLEPVRISPAAERARKLLLVNQLRVSGVRISERGNRALINDRLVKIGDTVESIPGLTVVEIEQESIVFTDDTGHRYTKRLQ
ncbi:hypothetical protein [Nibricoccus sp. IMCC34717]|uniref:hypothetical protein n=1 Tax=Nibricoccus sp. IMCC34717 TaxID=3034021 RepID=UPI00384D920A